MEEKKQEAASDNVRPLKLAPRVRDVPPLSDKEILALRELLKKADVIATACPIAQRALSKR
jgi:hypothetical protein